MVNELVWINHLGNLDLGVKKNPRYNVRLYLDMNLVWLIHVDGMNVLVSDECLGIFGWPVN